ncbi:4-hydroxythreonine-4-phosphate dehydrogenase [Balnearium lithotrophicum]|uniref:4-hydroxythreonine-4-phosphate dehydrogenase n=1 Tax=Balnearium lithotrophicum TaxID=223788 RepID=A0A521DPN2_9BACT|nr:4-hydroxythreonine-4-phosphate dehydrogenase [Balnearium lithotrophicum]
MGKLPASFTVYGSSGVLKFYSELLKLPLNFSPNVSLCDVAPNVEFQVGKASKESGRAQVEFLKGALSDAKEGKIDGVVTLPINKEAVRLAGFPFPGHTEFLAHFFKVKNFGMMLANERLKVVLLTTHVSLREVPDLVKRERILNKLELINSEFPGAKIGVCALNPHAGEGGLFGREEIEEIEPAIIEAKTSGIKAFGPFPSDTIFLRALKGDFDVVLAMYHDQGLIPIKLLGFGRSVNVTLGLPIVRTSVDHGTAYDIAGKGIADTGSFETAVRIAIELLKRKMS